MRKHVLLMLGALLTIVASADVSEIKVDLKLDADDYVVGERVRVVIDIANSSPDRLSYGYSNSKDRCFVEVFKSSDMQQLERKAKRPFVAPFRIDSGEGQKLEVFLADHYALTQTRRYLARPVLVHAGVRYEGPFRAFDVVDGVKVGGALQMFANRKDLQREFELVYWSRKHAEHLFLKARDADAHKTRWETRDLGQILRLDKPTVSILPSGEVIVLHRLNADQFVRSEFWSLPSALEFRSHELMRDPETAATSRVRDLYKEGGVKPKPHSWWKFWQ